MNKLFTYKRSESGTTSLIFFNTIQITREAPGVLLEGHAWIIFHECFMYGPCESLFEVVKCFVMEYQDDKHLCG